MHRTALCAGILLAMIATAPTVAADDYPTKPIKFIVPTAPAGIGDILVRMFQQRLGESGSTATIVVENRAGAAGVIGTDAVAKSPPDGTTFLVGNHAVLAMLPHLQKIPYNPIKDFSPVLLGVTVPNILVVHPSVPARSVKELIAYAKANPGKLTYASQGVGASGHIAAELFKLHAGVDIVHVPYKGAAPAAQDLAAGHVNMMFDVVSLALGPIQGGRVRPLGVTTTQRASVLPDVPTMIEQEYRSRSAPGSASWRLPERRRMPSPGSTARATSSCRRPTPRDASSTRARRCRSARPSRSPSSSRQSPTATAT
jgi:tripartite-type tricarboxylate transporter receptor subunit TctC